MSFRTRHQIPDLGVGVGFRIPHYGTILDERPPMDWFEVISENFMVDGGRPLQNLERLMDGYRVVPHGVSLAIGSAEALDTAYVARLKALLDRLEPPWVSDHLCWARAPGLHLHDLLPLPYTHEAIEHVVERVKRVQGTLERPFALENVSSYMTYRASEMTEWEFLAEVAEKADCGILLDCNNVYVSARNHGFDGNDYIDGVPAERVVQMHLAGHTDKGKYVLDTHSDFVRDEVWELYRRAVKRCGAVSTLIEWDEDIPAWDVLAEEARKARVARAEVLA
ncbi:MAG: DUF692 domain-containing protein [Deltaproteobacteria bacterium]|nr:DUF692 domain-containing protein [Deltaproteobacteria bacterium]